MHKFKKGDVVMVVDDQYEVYGLDPLASEGLFVGDLGVVGHVDDEFVFVTFIMSSSGFPAVPCCSHELYYIGRL